MSDLEQLARQCAEEIKRLEAVTPELQAAAEQILAITKKPTMADVDWDDEKHYLAGATTSNGGSVVMLWHDDIDTDHIITNHAEWPRDRLTPNGKKYELREVVDALDETIEPNRRRVLSTVEDYENAPLGTIVSVSEKVAKRDLLGWYFTGFESDHGSEYMARLGEGTVLRWGLDEVKEPSEPTAPLDERAESDQTVPATLVTEADYANAPDGTIVAEPSHYALTKECVGQWCLGEDWFTDRDLAGIERRVLRKGWGK